MVACPVANSYIQTAIGSAGAGAVAEMAATSKSTKYGALESQYTASNQLPWSLSASFFPTLVAGFCCGDDRETSFLFQRISVLLFRFNSVLLMLHDGFVLDDRPEK